MYSYDGKLRLDDFSEIAFTSESSYRLPYEKQETAPIQEDLINSYQFWSDEMLISAYDTYWNEAQDLKIQSQGASLDGSALSGLETRFDALWTILTERGIEHQTTSPDINVITHFLITDTDVFLDARLLQTTQP